MSAAQLQDYLQEYRQDHRNPAGTSTYRFYRSELGHHHGYVLPVLERELRARGLSSCRAFDLGCGNGSVAGWLHERGYDVVGADASIEGIEQASSAHPQIPFYLASAYDDLAAVHGTFSLVISLEVVEHLYAPRDFARTLYDLTESGGTAVVSTPFHGYWKNLMLAVTGKLDAHFSPLWDHGHIKFWSEENLRTLLLDAGFRKVAFRRAGRIPPLAKSTLAIASK